MRGMWQAYQKSARIRVCTSSESNTMAGHSPEPMAFSKKESPSMICIQQLSVVSRSIDLSSLTAALAVTPLDEQLSWIKADTTLEGKPRRGFLCGHLQDPVGAADEA